MLMTFRTHTHGFRFRCYELTLRACPAQLQCMRLRATLSDVQANTMRSYAGMKRSFNDNALEMSGISGTPPKKKACVVIRPRICMRCFNGESGHITHILSEMPIDIAIGI
ncbi:hypothetical protein AB6A40_008965 [Gnathostoma spinigerum]|uniref:Uncharacterized protein n=1 Tax=Gnathostoma spinigerum TaxID=75299 RepID=A0ABD6EXP9_9BILA